MKGMKLIALLVTYLGLSYAELSDQSKMVSSSQTISDAQQQILQDVVGYLGNRFKMDHQGFKFDQFFNVTSIGNNLRFKAQFKNAQSQNIAFYDVHYEPIHGNLERNTRVIQGFIIDDNLIQGLTKLKKQQQQPITPIKTNHVTQLIDEFNAISQSKKTSQTKKTSQAKKLDKISQKLREIFAESKTRTIQNSSADKIQRFHINDFQNYLDSKVYNLYQLYKNYSDKSIDFAYQSKIQYKEDELDEKAEAKTSVYLRKIRTEDLKDQTNKKTKDDIAVPTKEDQVLGMNRNLSQITRRKNSSTFKSYFNFFDNYTFNSSQEAIEQNQTASPIKLITDYDMTNIEQMYLYLTQNDIQYDEKLLNQVKREFEFDNITDATLHKDSSPVDTKTQDRSEPKQIIPVVKIDEQKDLSEQNFQKEKDSYQKYYWEKYQQWAREYSAEHKDLADDQSPQFDFTDDTDTSYESSMSNQDFLEQNQEVERIYDEYFNRQFGSKHQTVDDQKFTSDHTVSYSDTLGKVYEIYKKQIESQTLNYIWVEQENITRFENENQNLTFLADQGISYMYDISGYRFQYLISAKQQNLLANETNYNLVLKYQNQLKDSQYFLTTINMNSGRNFGQIVAVDRLQQDDIEE